jgi:hypothetical protein
MRTSRQGSVRKFPDYVCCCMVPIPMQTHSLLGPTDTQATHNCRQLPPHMVPGKGPGGHRCKLDENNWRKYKRLSRMTQRAAPPLPKPCCLDSKPTTPHETTRTNMAVPAPTLTCQALPAGHAPAKGMLLPHTMAQKHVYKPSWPMARTTKSLEAAGWCSIRTKTAIAPGPLTTAELDLVPCSIP